MILSKAITGGERGMIFFGLVSSVFTGAELSTWPSLGVNVETESKQERTGK